MITGAGMGETHTKELLAELLAKAVQMVEAAFKGHEPPSEAYALIVKSFLEDAPTIVGFWQEHSDLMPPMPPPFNPDELLPWGKEVAPGIYEIRPEVNFMEIWKKAGTAK